MKIFFDTNIFIDILLQQEPFFIDSLKALILADVTNAEVFLSANSVTDIYYIVAKRTHDKEKAYMAVNSLLSMAKISSVTEREIYEAHRRHSYDFEDCLIAVCAENVGAEIIITRDKKGFAAANLDVYTPTEFLEKSGL